MIIVGEKEEKSKTLSIRSRDNKEPSSTPAFIKTPANKKTMAGKQQVLKIEEFTKKITEKMESKKI